MGFNRMIAGDVTIFGVSGSFYQSHILLCDRSTESLWSQMMVKSVAGPRLS